MLFSLIEKNDFDCLRSLKDNGVVEGVKVFIFSLRFEIYLVLFQKNMMVFKPLWFGLCYHNVK